MRFFFSFMEKMVLSPEVDEIVDSWGAVKLHCISSHKNCSLNLSFLFFFNIKIILQFVFREKGLKKLQINALIE